MKRTGGIDVAGGSSRDEKKVAVAREEEGPTKGPRWQRARLEATTAVGSSGGRVGDEKGWSAIGAGATKEGLGAAEEGLAAVEEGLVAAEAAGRRMRQQPTASGSSGWRPELAGMVGGWLRLRVDCGSKKQRKGAAATSEWSSGRGGLATTDEVRQQGEGVEEIGEGATMK
ncbi:hypothetical protein BHM03_00002997 [Ensete ventricosum]|uniref:DUF834 domain-containing protein n=1 Tax=Ensete ventricosum TaxID=4639 RepID=A0A445M9Y0_ENSVE|nr:hypothetical protein BHM03_00002997 [Ensete ventricosum]